MRKPHSKIYALALKKAKVEAEETIFIDDKEKLLQPAKELGMKTILFETPKKLRQELKQLEIL